MELTFFPQLCRRTGIEQPPIDNLHGNQICENVAISLP